MVDVWKELVRIDMANFGWELREPMRNALVKFNKLAEVTIDDELSIIGNYPSKGSLKPLAPTGDGVITSFLKAILLIRSSLRCSAADEHILSIVNNYLAYSLGANYKRDIYKTIKAMMNGVNEGYPEEIGYTLIDKIGSAIFIAGNENTMITPHNSEIAGLSLYFEEDVKEEEFIMCIENVLDGSYLTQRYTPTQGEANVVMFLYDEITNLISPGILRITITDAATGKIRDDVRIYSDACKFGMAEAEGYFMTTERDYVYTTDATSSHILLYIGPFKRIKVPRTLDSKPVQSISSSAFYEQGMEAIKMDDEYNSIEIIE